MTLLDAIAKRLRGRTDEAIAAELTELRRRRRDLASVRTREDVAEAVESFVASARGMAASRAGLAAVFGGSPPTSEQAAWVAAYLALTAPDVEERLRARAPADLPSREAHARELRKLDDEIRASEVELRRREIDAERADAEARLEALAAEAEKPAV